MFYSLIIVFSAKRTNQQNVPI